MKIRSLLIANRGEIARRIIRTAREMGMRTVAIYSEADRNAPYVCEADSAFHIGPAEAAKSYLDGDRVIETALRAGVDAIHPGYGFLAENADFASSCEAAGLRFVGPSPDVIRIMGSKIEAKKQAIGAEVPVVPGYDGADQSDNELSVQAERIGFPLMIKASAGGGGRGMRIVEASHELASALPSARAEAGAGFGDPTLLLERYVSKARHIEVQILGDAFGNILHLFERDCSLQRNHQKVIEEAPAPSLSDNLRQEILQSAMRLARAIGYQNAGTVEYLLDDATGEFFFLEMNTRLQVEHPVTEAITGLNLVEYQLRVADGEQLTLKQEEICCNGWAIEARVAAEDPANEYRPETGLITSLSLPYACRVDSGVETGSKISHHYDSMLAKVVSHADTRTAAIAKLINGLSSTRMDGPGNNLAFLIDLLRTEHFTAGAHHTGTITDLYPDGWKVVSPTSDLCAVAVLARYFNDLPRNAGPWQDLGPWRSISPAGRTGQAVYYLDRKPVELCQLDNGWEVRFLCDTRHSFIHVTATTDRLIFEKNAERYEVGFSVSGSTVKITSQSGRFAITVETGEETFLADTGNASPAGNSHEIRAPMPGLVVDLLQNPGTRLAKGDPVIVIEAMKLMQTLTAPCNGVLNEVAHQPGDTVEKHALLAVFLPEENSQ